MWGSLYSITIAKGQGSWTSRFSRSLLSTTSWQLPVTASHIANHRLFLLPYLFNVVFAGNQLFADQRVKDAMLSVDRGDFAPSTPYGDHPVSIGYSATISAPHMVSCCFSFPLYFAFLS